MGFFIVLLFIVLFLLVIGFFLHAGILFALSHVFQIKKAVFKESVAVALIVSLFFAFTFYIPFLSIVGGFFLLHYFFRKYYQTSWKKSLGVYVLYCVFGGVISLLFFFPLSLAVRAYVVSPFQVSGEAMKPTYLDGDYLLVNKYDRKFERGDIVVFKPPNSAFFFIQRIIGLPNETLEIKGGDVYVGGQELGEDYLENSKTFIAGFDEKKFEIPADSYFVLGDNRENSLDSRYCFRHLSVGCKEGHTPYLPVDRIQGKVAYAVSRSAKK